MAKLKTVKSKNDFKSGVLALLKSHNIEVPELEQERLTENMLVYFNNHFKPPKDKTEYWPEIVSLYFQFYEETVGEKPAFLGTESKALKEISKVLMERYLHKNKNGIWDLKTCLQQFRLFYQAMCSLHHVKSRFSISYIALNFDKLVSELSAKK